MKRLLILLSISCLVTLLPGCGGGESSDSEDRGSFRKGPISIRGWVSEIDIGQPDQSGVFSVTGLGQGKTAYQKRLLEETNISIEGVGYASGRIVDSGSFIILDSPPGDLLVNFQAPGVSLVQLALRGIPPNSDVFVPGVKLYPDRLEILEPEKIVVRVPGSGTERKLREEPAMVAGHRVDVWEVPLREMMDRRDMPFPN